MMSKANLLVLCCFFVTLLSACSRPQTEILRLGTTTSMDDSGLLDTILPDFESQYQAKVEVIAVGTGQAIALGKLGDVDVVLVHAASLEIPFVEEGYGEVRTPVMYNDFVIVGPNNDPAMATLALNAADLLSRIAEAQYTFVSRGDNSGTHVREHMLWREAGLTPGPQDSWYLSIGQGMGATLNFANEEGAYTLTDRGTFIALRENLPNLEVIFKGNSPPENPDPALRNDYSVIPINPLLHPKVNAELSRSFVDWLISIPTQKMIHDFAVDRFGQPLFYPDSELWHSE